MSVQDNQRRDGGSELWVNEAKERWRESQGELEPWVREREETERSREN